MKEILRKIDEREKAEYGPKKVEPQETEESLKKKKKE